MKKYLLAMILAAASSFSANASYIQLVNGAELAGIEVIAETTQGTEIATWQATSSTGGLAAGASDWTLKLDGDTFGSNTNTPGVYVGLFQFLVGGLDISSLTLNMVGTGLVFDTAFGDASANGSGAGRVMAIMPDTTTYSVGYSNLVEDELYQTVTISAFGNFLAGNEYGFLTDIDAMATDVPAPAGLALLALGLLGVRLTRRNK
jgi:MYXO-CTERM domain-containing protein